MNDTLYIVMPAYNEEENIETVVSDWYSVLSCANEHSRLLVADTGSTDNTHAILDRLQKEYPQLVILETAERFHGPKLMSLYDHAIKSDADYIFQTDSDGQTDVAEFDRFWAEREHYAGIFGNRTVRGDGVFRAFVEKVVCIFVKVFFGVRVPDANAPFRLMKAETLKKYLYRLPGDYNIPNIVLTSYFVYCNERCKFIEISFAKRKKGKNSINIRKIISIGLKAAGDFRRIKKDMENIRRGGDDNG